MMPIEATGIGIARGVGKAAARKTKSPNNGSEKEPLL
jgi:hypothetical protein